MLFIIYLSYIFLIQPLLESRAEINISVGFLAQMKSLEFAFEISLPLLSQLSLMMSAKGN